MSVNFARSTVAVPPSPASSGTSIGLPVGHGARFIAGSAFLSPPNVVSTPLNAEVVTVTAVVDDVLTVVRGVEGSTAREIGTGWNIGQGLTAGQYDALAVLVAGKLGAASNLLDVANAGTARTNLGLGTSAVMSTAQIAADAALTGTYAPITGSSAYETLLGGKLGRRRVRTLVGPSVMTSPPTIGALATSSAIASGVNWTTLISPLVNGSGVTTNIFRVLGTGNPVQYGTGNPDAIFTKYQSVTTTNSATSPFRVAFWFDGTTLEFLFKGMTGAYRIRVDGQLVASAGVAISNTGSYYRLPVTFAARAQRYIEFEGFGLPFAGVISGPLDTVWQPQPRGPRCVVLGDSYTEGTGSDGINTWVRSFSDLMNWPDTFNAGVGSTGFINPGSAGRVKFRDRLTADVTAWNPDIVVVAGGHNDTASTNPDIQTEVGLLFAALRAALPNAALICAGPFFAGGTPGVYTAMQTAIFAGAAPYVLGTIDTCSAPWFTGSGRVGATTGSGNSDLYISSDGTHPSQAGHDYMARRMAEGVSSLLAA